MGTVTSPPVQNSLKICLKNFPPTQGMTYDYPPINGTEVQFYWGYELKTGIYHCLCLYGLFD